MLHNLRLRGELSNFKRHSSGHWYFTLKDEDSRIPRYVYQDGTVDIAMQIDRVSYQDLGGQWCPIPQPRKPKE